MSSFGAGEKPFINCPTGATRNFDADTQEEWCEDAAGNRIAAIHPPGGTAKAAVDGGLGITGWVLVIAGGLLVAAMVVGKKSAISRRAAPRLRRRSRLKRRPKRTTTRRRPRVTTRRRRTTQRRKR